MLTLEEIDLIEDDRERFFQLAVYWKNINIKTATDLIVDDFKNRICDNCKYYIFDEKSKTGGCKEENNYIEKFVPKTFGCNFWDKLL